MQPFAKKEEREQRENGKKIKRTEGKRGKSYEQMKNEGWRGQEDMLEENLRPISTRRFSGQWSQKFAAKKLL